MPATKAPGIRWFGNVLHLEYNLWYFSWGFKARNSLSSVNIKCVNMTDTSCLKCALWTCFPHHPLPPPPLNFGEILELWQKMRKNSVSLWIYWEARRAHNLGTEWFTRHLKDITEQKIPGRLQKTRVIRIQWQDIDHWKKGMFILFALVLWL